MLLALSRVYKDWQQVDTSDDKRERDQYALRGTNIYESRMFSVMLEDVLLWFIAIPEPSVYDLFPAKNSK